MKTRIYILFCGILIGINCLSQNKNDSVRNQDTNKCTPKPVEISYDFKTKKPERVPYCRHNQYVTYRINNINRFLYKTTIKAEQSIYQSEMPNVFSQYFKLSDKKVENVESAKNASNEILQKQAPDKYETILKEAEKEADRDSIETDNSTTRKGNDDSAQNGNEERLKDIQINLYKTLRIYKQLESLKTTNNQLKDLTYMDIDYQTSLKLVGEIVNVNSHLKDPEQLLSSFYDRHNKLSMLINEYTKLLNKSLRDNTIKKAKDETEKRNTDNLHKIIIKDSLTLINLNVLSNQIIQIKANVDNYGYNELFSSIKNLLFELRKEGNFFIVSDPIQAKNDEVNFNIDITPIPKYNSLSNLDTRSFSTTIPVNCGVKFGYSTGIFASTLNDMKYSVLDSAGYKKIVNDSNKNFVNLSIGALMHVYWRTACDFSLGLCLGTGITSTNDMTKLNVFFGPSVIIGRQEQFIISGGCAIGQVDRLKTEYKSIENKGKWVPANNIYSDLTVKVNQMGWFVSVTYNLSNSKKN